MHWGMGGCGHLLDSEPVPVASEPSTLRREPRSCSALAAMSRRSCWLLLSFDIVTGTCGIGFGDCKLLMYWILDLFRLLFCNFGLRDGNLTRLVFNNKVTGRDQTLLTPKSF